jgi:sigma-E factor negative regulatory protein RseA
MTLMTQQIQDQMSAFVDDELSAEECAFLVRRLEHDPGARGKLERYTMIGCALRGELLQPDPGILRRRLQEALTGTAAPPRKAAAAAPDWRLRLSRPLFGVGIAASAAVVGLIGVSMMNVAPDMAEPPLQAADWLEPSYVVPQGTSEQRAVTAPIRLTNYLMHHGEYASRLSRTSVDSNVVGARELPDSLQGLQPEPASDPGAEASAE